MEKDAVLNAAQKIKLVVSDLDYTLLNDRRELTEYTKQTIRALRQAGIQFTICTARAGAMSKYYEEELELDIPFVGSNGSSIIDPRTGTYKFLRELDKEQAIGCIQLCLDKNIQVVAITPHEIYGHIYRQEDLSRFQSNMKQTEHGQWDGLKKMDRPLHTLFEKEQIIKITMFGLTKEQSDCIRRYCDQYDTLECGFSDNTVMGISPSGEDKGTGLVRLRRMLHLEKEQLCVFGDYTTDIPMFHAAGLSFAMKNGKEDAKAAATAVCAFNNNEDGVAKTLQKYFLQGNPR